VDKLKGFQSILSILSIGQIIIFLKKTLLLATTCKHVQAGSNCLCVERYIHHSLCTVTSATSCNNLEESFAALYLVCILAVRLSCWSVVQRASVSPSLLLQLHHWTGLLINNLKPPPQELLFRNTSVQP